MAAEVGLTTQIQTRRPYRSVAFGTWKVGGAREFNNQRHWAEHGGDFRKSSSPSQPYLTKRLNRNSRLGESSPNLSRIHQTETQYSLELPPLNMSHSTMDDHRLGNRDFYSSSEYCQYVNRTYEMDSINGNPEPIHAVLKGSISRGDRPVDRGIKHSTTQRRKSRQDPAERNHHRSHSAGADTVYTVNASTSSSAKMGGLARAPISSTDVSGANAGTNTKFLRATKRFFKKIYTNATTLPKKSTSASTDHLQQLRHQPPPFFERVEDAAEDYGSDLDVIGSKTLDVSYPDSGFEMDSCRASTPDHSLESMLTSSSKSSSDSTSSAGDSRQFSMTSPGSVAGAAAGDQPFNGWNNLFEHLRREMTEMRERDAQILADLHRVEEQIQSVRLAQMGYADQSGFVESMPL